MPCLALPCLLDEPNLRLQCDGGGDGAVIEGGNRRGHDSTRAGALGSRRSVWAVAMLWFIWLIVPSADRPGRHRHLASRRGRRGQAARAARQSTETAALHDLSVQDSKGIPCVRT